MRVALTTYALHVGGLETFIFTLARGLLEAGHEPHIVVTDERGAWFERASETGARTHFIDGRERRSRAAHARAVAGFLEDGGFDAVINNFSWPVQASLGLLRPGTATVSVIHNSVESVLSLSCSNAAVCQAFVAPSPATFDLARARVLDPGQVRLIHHGVEIPPLPERNRGPALAAVYCGRLQHAQKGILLLPEIVGRVCSSGVDIRLEVIGEGPDRTEFERLVREAGIEGRVQLTGPLGPAQSLEHLSRAEVLILPSFFEGLPLVPLESMARGVVPVISLLPGITDWIVDNGSSGFLLPAGDVKGFSDALVRLGLDPDLRRRMSAAAAERARQRFSVGRMVASYIGLLEELRSRPARSGLPGLAPDMVQWKDHIPPTLRQAGGRLLRRVRASRSRL